MSVEEIIEEKGTDCLFQKLISDNSDKATGGDNEYENVITVLGIKNDIRDVNVVTADKVSVIATHKLMVMPFDEARNCDRVIIDDEKYEIKYITDPMNFNEFYKIYLTESDNYGDESS